MHNNFSTGKKLMDENDITQKDWANKLSITTATISRWLSGEIMSRLDKILVLYDLFKVDLYSILGVDDPNNLMKKKKGSFHNIEMILILS